MPRSTERRLLLALRSVPLGVTVGLSLIAASLHSPPEHAAIHLAESTYLISHEDPTPSGADPLYPLNHTLDGKTESLGSPSNAGFEQAGGQVGTPPSNHDLETPPVDSVTVPNGDFETGTFADWTLTGSPTIDSDPTHGYFAKLTAGHAITSSAIAVPSTAQALVYQVGYLTTNNYSWVKVYVLSGPDFSTSALIKDDACAACGTWSTTTVSLSAYRNQTIKLKFSRYAGTVGINDVKVQEVFPDFEVSGTYARIVEGGDAHVRLSSGSTITTAEAFAVHADAQTGTVELKGETANSQYQIQVATGPSYSTFTTVASGLAPTTWQPVRFSLAAYAGQQIKLRVRSAYGWIRADDIGVHHQDLPGWTVSGLVDRVEDGAGNQYATTTGSITSAAFELPAGVQNIGFAIRSATSSTQVTVFLLRGPDFSTSTQIHYDQATSSWKSVTDGVAPYAGETVKLKIERGIGGTLHIDDAGLLESVLPGWTPDTTDPVATGENDNGTFAKPLPGWDAVFLRSSFISTGIVDRPSQVDKRQYRVSYELGAGGLLQDDDAGRMTAETDPLGNTTTYGYDAADRRTSLIDATDRTTTYGYDAAGQLVTVTDPGGQTTTNAYDAGGHVASVTTPSGAVTSYAYNSRGLLSSVIDPLLNETIYGYDDAGRMTSETDPLGNETSYGYDGAGRLTSITDDLGGVVGLGYDAASQLTSVTDPRNQTWTYDYNPLGVRTSVIDPLDRETTWGYDAAGQPTSRIDARGIATSHGYDLAGQRTSTTYPGGSVTYAYDDAGARTGMTDPTGQTATTYDAAGRVTSVATSRGQITYTYDEAGRRASMTLPGNRTVTYAHNDRGLLSSLTDWQDRTTTFAYDADGNRTHISRPNGVDSIYTYDTSGRVSEITHTKGQDTLLALSYTYDDAGRRASATGPDGTETYGYDNLGRLTSVSYPGGPSLTYAYDGAGNRTTETRDGVTTDYTYDDAGQLISVGSKTYSYDENGNLLQAGSDTFAWDFDNRLTQATIGPHTASYSYDGDGTRVGATVDGNASSFLVDAEGGLPTLVDDGSRAYLHADGLLAEVGGGTRYPLADALGSVRGLSDDAGSLVGTASYEAFGAPRVASGASSLFGFAGEPTDAIGLVYLRARTMDPATGRFLSADTVIPNAPGISGYNFYAYAGNGPTTWTDPTGHFVEAPPEAPPLKGAVEAGVDWARELVLRGMHTGQTVALVAFIASLASDLAIMVTAIVGILVLAAFLYVGILWLQIQLAGLASNASWSSAGETHWPADALLAAPGTYPAPPTVLEMCPSCVGGIRTHPNPPIPWTDPTQPPGPGWRWRGNGLPGSDKGQWYNPTTGEWVHRHSKPSKHGYHWDYNDGEGHCWRIYPDGKTEPKPC